MFNTLAFLERSRVLPRRKETTFAVGSTHRWRCSLTRWQPTLTFGKGINRRCWRSFFTFSFSYLPCPGKWKLSAEAVVNSMEDPTGGKSLVFYFFFVQNYVFFHQNAFLCFPFAARFQLLKNCLKRLAVEKTRNRERESLTVWRFFWRQRKKDERSEKESDSRKKKTRRSQKV